MNGPLFDDLIDQFRGTPAQALGEHLGLTQDAALQAVTAALPLIFGALQRNTRDISGAEALFSALETDHRGVDPSNALSNALAGGGSGAGILRHLFGDGEPEAARAVGSVAGIDRERGNVLLRTLAPAVMAYVARRIFTSRHADGASTPQPSPRGLQDALASEVDQMESASGDAGTGVDTPEDGLGERAPTGVDGNGAAPAPLPVQTAEMRSPRPLL